MSSNGERDLEIIRGDDKYYDLVFKDSNGDPIDITGWKLYFTVKKNLGDSDTESLIQKDITSHTDPANGKTRFHLTNSETEITGGDYFYDIQVKKQDDTIFTISIGKFKVVQDRTRRKT